MSRRPPTQTIVLFHRGLRLIAGTFVLASLALAYIHSPSWHLFTAFVGFNLLQSGFTNWCPMMSFRRAVGVKDQSSPATRRAA